MEATRKGIKTIGKLSEVGRKVVWLKNHRHRKSKGGKSFGKSGRGL